MSETPRQKLLRAALEALRGLCGDGVALPLRVTVESQGGDRVIFESRPGELPVNSDGQTLSDMEQAIVSVLQQAAVPMAAKQIARKAGYAYSGPFRVALRALSKRSPAIVSRDVDGWSIVRREGLDRAQSRMESRDVN